MNITRDMAEVMSRIYWNRQPMGRADWCEALDIERAIEADPDTLDLIREWLDLVSDLAIDRLETTLDDLYADAMGEAETQYGYSVIEELSGPLFADEEEAA